ncbi:hypothetical protein T08_15754 [Trichinella sp. T8]|nr:hypothetical protein T08_15754 [Trichinella sp. T8]
MTELLGAGATGNDWSGQKQRHCMQASAEIKASCMYQQLNNRCRRIIDCFDDSLSIGPGGQSQLSNYQGVGGYRKYRLLKLKITFLVIAFATFWSVTRSWVTASKQ